MRTIKTELIINRVAIKKDDSISFTATTPALTDEELGGFRHLSKVLVNVLMEPQKGGGEVLEIKEKIDDGKSPSARLRSVLFVWFSQLGEPGGDFELFYREKMNMLIEKIKEKLT